MTEERALDTLSFIAEVGAPLLGRRVIDIGCGGGALARALHARGAKVTGVDPSPDAVAAARAAVPEGRFERASGGALPFEAGSFDLAVFLNSLHHVPVAEMQEALGEALRIVAPHGRVVVVEPLARGSLFEVLLQVEDETAVRAAAQDAIRATVAEGAARLLREVEYERLDLYADYEGFARRIGAADPAREAALRDGEATIRAVFTRMSVPQEGRFALRQPLRAQLLGPL